MDSKDIGMEALVLTSVQHNFLYKYSSDSSYTKASPLSTNSVLDLITKMSKDERFSKLPKDIDFQAWDDTFAQNEDLLMEYWNGWSISDPLRDFEASQQAAVDLFVSSVDPKSSLYNFFVVHLLTTSYAVRVLLPFFPAQYHISLVRQWWLLVIAVCVMKGRPCPNHDNVEKKLEQRDWKYVQDKAINSAWSNDAHYVKGT